MDLQRKPLSPFDNSMMQLVRHLDLQHEHSMCAVRAGPEGETPPDFFCLKTMNTYDT